MKKEKLVLFTFSALAIGAITACGGTSSSSFNNSLISNTWGDEFKTVLLADFNDNKTPNGFEVSNGWSNEGVFDNTYWNEDNVTYNDGKMELSITDNPNPDPSGKYKYYTGESRTTNHFQYGSFSVKMKPMKAVGTCSAFFAYTGSSFDGNEDEQPDQWEEIDIEFLGKYHNRVQFNYYSIEGGEGVGHEYWYDLGFDATEEYHEYGFLWEEDRIVWFVDGEAVYEATKDIPSTPLRIFTNAWAGNSEAAGWMDTFKGVDANTCTAYYDEIGWADLEGNGYVPPEVEQPNEITYEDLDVDFATNDQAYTVTNNEDGTSNVTYSNVSDSSYINVYTDLPENAKNKNVVNLKLTNNGEKEVGARINVVDKNIIVNNDTVKTAAVNVSATQDGVPVNTDLVWGGSYFSIAPGATIDCVIFYESTKTMVANKLEIMLDSYQAAGNTSAGDVTISNVKLGVEEGFVPVEPDDPTETGDVLDLDFYATDPKYVVTNNDDKTTSVTYTDVADNSYMNAFADLPVETADNNVLVLKLTNNDTDKTVNARINVVDKDFTTTETIKTAAVNVSATQDGTPVRTDLEWGGSYFTIAPNTTILCKIVYENSEEKTADRVEIMLDSFGESGAISSGNVTISEVKLGVKKAPEEPTLGEATPFDFTIDGGNTDFYNVTKDNESGTSTITYESTGSYTNISGAIGSVATAQHGQIAFKVNNTGSENIAIRLDMYHYNAWGTSLVSAATLDENIITIGGDNTATFDIAPGEHTITIDYKGSVTNLCFYIDSMSGTSKAGSFTIGDFTHAAYNE